MRPRVAIVDYGVGNLFSVRGALEYCGADSVLTQSHRGIETADRLLLPGVGAFSVGMAEIHRLNMIGPIKRFLQTGKSLLGICLGMQMLMTESEEFGRHDGLDLIPGAVRAIPLTGTDGRPHCIPHVGWSGLNPRDGADWQATPLRDLAPGTEVYFAHSFHAQPKHSRHLVATCDYDGHSITAVVRRDNMIGCQFHPEKSGESGLSIIRSFLKL